MFAKRMTGLLLCLALLIFLMPFTAMAATQTQNGLQVKLTTDKSVYSVNEDVAVIVTVTNTNDFAVSNVNLELLLPEGMSVKSDEPKTINLAAGQTLDVSFTAQNDNSGNVPKTGDGYTALLIAFMLAAGIFAYLLTMRRRTCRSPSCNSASGLVSSLKKIFPKILSLFLCFALLIPNINVFPVSAETSGKDFTVEETVTIGGKQQKIAVRISILSSDGKLTVSFETNGGSEISPVLVTSGSELSDVSVPLKDDYVFTGWYKDKNLTEKFYSDVPVSENMTLYASYTERDYNYQEYTDSVKFIKDCDNDIAIEVLSSETITEENIDDYITIKDECDEIPGLDVTSIGGDVYSITPQEPYYTPGDTYEMTLSDYDVSFNDQKEQVRTIAFSVFKPETYDVARDDEIVYLLWSDVNIEDDENGVYSLTAAFAQQKGIAEGVTICLWNGQFDEQTKLRNILSCEAAEGSDPQRVLLITEPSNIEDIYNKLDVHLTEIIDPEEYIDSLDTKQIEQTLKNSESTLKFTKFLAAALGESRTVAGMSSSAFAAPTENNDKFNLTVDALVSGLTITASVGTAQNTNFPGAASNTWLVLTVQFAYNTVISGKVQVDADFTFKEFITVSVGKNIDWEPFVKFDYDVWLDTYSQTEVSFNILVKTVSEDSDFINITDEIQNLIDNVSEDNSAVPGIISEVLGSKGDYIDLAKIDLYEHTFNIKEPVPVVQIKLDMDFVVRLNLAVGLSANSTLMSANRIGIRGGRSKDTEEYNYSLEGDGRQSFDLYCAGYLGVKAGIRLTLSANFMGLEDVGRVGFTGEVGAYMDLYGFLQLHLLKNNQNASPNININGGIYMEVGIYVELSIFAESKIFKVKAECSLLDKKFPLYSLGDRYVLYSFENAGNTVIMNANSYPLGGGGLLEVQMLDLTTGQLVQGNYSKLKNFYFSFSHPFFYIDDNDKENLKVAQFAFDTSHQGVFVPVNTQRLDATVEIYYGGSNLCFSTKKKGYTYNEIKIIWIDPGVDASKIDNLDTVTATYVLNLDGEKTVLLTKPVLAGMVAGAYDLSEYTDYAKVTGYENDWSNAMWQDTVYTVDMSMLQVLVSYMYVHDRVWQYKIYACQKDSVAPDPSPEELSTGQLRKFRNWLRSDYRFLNPYPTKTMKTDTITQNDIVCADMLGMTYTGYDTTAPVFSFSGTYKQCCEKFYENQKTMNTMLLKVANYDYIAPQITFVYPSMRYRVFGQDMSVSFQDETRYNVFYDEIPAPTKHNVYPGCDILGWDENGDGIADYTYDGLPPVTESKKYKLIVKIKTYTATVLDADGNTLGTETVNIGNLPAAIYTKPAHPSGNDKYRFEYWEASVSGGDFVKWDESKDYGMNSDWTLRPVYAEYYNVTFDYGEGSYNGKDCETVSVKAGQYILSELTSAVPVCTGDNITYYTFGGWDGDSVVNVNRNLVFHAMYTPHPVQYTATFETSVGQFSGGTSTVTMTGSYSEYITFINDFLASNSQFFHVYTDDTVYTFHSWSIYNGEYSVRYVANWSSSARTYTVAFDAGEGQFGGGITEYSLPYSYGANADLSSANGAYKSADNYYIYKLAGWRDQNGNVYGVNGVVTVHGDMTFTAIYEQDGHVLYTVTLIAGGGKFANGTDVKTFVGAYGDPTNISVSDPVWETNYAQYYYVFDGWSADFPATFSGNQTISARYRTVYYNYSITFDAGSGSFAGGVKTIGQTYHYGDEIVPPDDPSIPENDYFRYEFTGWSPALTAGQTVAYNRTYTAAYRSISKNATLPASGINVTKNGVTEDICVGSIAGYTYSMMETYNSGVYIPVLTITGNGLTFSGTSSTVYVIVSETVTNVTFNGLNLSGGYEYMDGVINVPKSVSALTVHITGSCVFRNTAEYRSTMRIERPAAFIGSDENASMQLDSIESTLIYSVNDLTFDTLHLTISADNGIDNDDSYVYVLSGDTGGEEQIVCSFLNSNVNITSDGFGLSTMMLSLVIRNSVFNIDCEGCAFSALAVFTVQNSAITVTTEQGVYVAGDAMFSGSSQITLKVSDSSIDMPVLWADGMISFNDFTGSFEAYWIDESTGRAAVCAVGEIRFVESGQEVSSAGYNLNGAVIMLFTDPAGNYYSFSNVADTPVAHVRIN